MRPASAAPVAGSAGIPAVPKTPASSLPSAGRFRTAAPPHAGSVLPHTPPVELARIVPRLSSPALCPSRQKVIYCRIFTPVQPDYPAASIEGFSLRRLHLYGATRYGGANGGANERYGAGTVFELTPNAARTAWTQKVLYSFCAEGGNCI